MGQATLTGPNVEEALETLVPSDIIDLPKGCVRFTFLTSEQGGILDNLMVTHRNDHLFLIVNAACKEAGFAHISEVLVVHIH